jgi:hypothetical protein
LVLLLLLAARFVSRVSTKTLLKHQRTRVNFVLQALRLRIQIQHRRSAKPALMESINMKILVLVFSAKIALLDSAR